MKILIDHIAFDLQDQGGVTRYNSALIHGLPELGAELILPFEFSDNKYLSELKQPHETKYKWTQKITKQNWSRNIWLNSTLFNSSYLQNIKSSIASLNNNDFDVFHLSYYSTYFLKYLENKPFVLTVHDMTHELFPQYFKFYDDTKSIKKLLIQKADHIIAVSQNTKKDICEIYNIKPNKISVIHHASSLVNSTESIESDTKYVLYIGARNGYKNFEFMVEAIAETLIKTNTQLLCIGAALSSKEKRLLKAAKLSKLVWTQKCTDTELAYFYSNAICLIYPSLYEGFGIPILEAFNCHCPVVCSNTSSLPEVGSNAVEYFDPRNKKDIADKVELIISNSSRRMELKIKGKTRAPLFSWKKCCKETLDVYNSLL